MAWYTATAADTIGPSPSRTYDGSWLNENSSIPIRATDNGLGVKSLGLQTAAGAPIGLPTSFTCTPTGTQVCAFDSTTANGGTTVTAPVGSLPEGTTSAKVTAVDAAETPASSSNFDVKVDKSPPGRTFTGTLWERRDAQLTGPDDDGDWGLLGEDGTLQVTASDGASGVASVELRVDGQLKSPQHRINAACSAAGCPANLTANFTVPFTSVTEGTHEISVIVRDQMASASGVTDNSHTRVEKFTVTFETEEADLPYDAPDPIGPNDTQTTPEAPIVGEQGTLSATPGAANAALRSMIDGNAPAGGVARRSAETFDVEGILAAAARNPTSDLARVLGGSGYTITSNGPVLNDQNQDGNATLVGAYTTLRLKSPRAVADTVGCYVPNKDGSRKPYDARIEADRLIEIEVEVDRATAAISCIAPSVSTGSPTFEPAPGEPELPPAPKD